MAQRPKLQEEKDLFEKAVPARAFISLEQLDRYRNFSLGLPVPRLNAKIPWGYFEDPANRDNFLPDDRALRLLWKVKGLLKDYNYMDMAAWLTKAGYPISHNGLHKLMMSRQPFDEILLPLEERMKL